MRNDEKTIEDVICFSLTKILRRTLTLDVKVQIAISQEFREWIQGDTKDGDIWVLDNPIK